MREAPAYDQNAQVITTEWIVTFFRWVVLGIFILIRHYVVPQSQAYIEPLYFFIILGALYNLYAIYLLYTGEVQRDMPHFVSFFLVVDILLLVSLVFFSSIYEQGLLTFYFFLIIVVALRSSLRLSLILGPIIALAYFFSAYLFHQLESLSPGRMVLDVVGLMVLSAACGWFAEGKSQAWKSLNHLSGRLKKVSLDLDDAHSRLGLYQKLEEMRRNFLAVMSHELRTPLTGVIGYTDLLLLEEAGPLTGKQRGFLTEMLQKSQELLNLIDNILDLSKIQSGRWALRTAYTSPRELIERALEPLLFYAGQKGLDLAHLPSPDKKLPDIPVDREKIERALSNVIGNAIKFTPRGGMVRIIEELGEDPYLENYFPHLITSTEVVTFSVIDNGPGVPREEREKIFEKFYRVHDGEGGDYSQGSGLGLSIAKEIVELHWGRIWCEETPGGGSTFRFTLPVKPMRLRKKIALMRTDFDLVKLLEGLLLQFAHEVTRKNLSVMQRGWPREGGAPLMLNADHQLIQCVLFNIFNNQIRYAFPESDLTIAVEAPDEDRQIRILFQNQGETMDREAMDRLKESGGRIDDPASMDLRRANVNLNLARDIVESHGGSLEVKNIPGPGVAISIQIPLDDNVNSKGGPP